ncbi:MAG: hypothetical protein WCC72_08370 [Dehalococcoidales bacterium]
MIDSGAVSGGLTTGIVVPTDVVLVNDDIVVDVAPVAAAAEVLAEEVLHPADSSPVQTTRIIIILRIDISFCFSSPLYLQSL